MSYLIFQEYIGLDHIEDTLLAFVIETPLYRIISKKLEIAANCSITGAEKLAVGGSAWGIITLLYKYLS